MALLPQGTFDSSQHGNMQGDFDPIPKGQYPAHVTGSEVKATKAKTGKYISLEFTIIDGDYKGRKIWTNLNIINPNPIAVEIAQKELATICRAVGKANIEDTQELHAIPFLMDVKVVPAKNDYPSKNEPCGYSPMNGNAGPAETSQGEKSGGVPWGNKG